MVLNSGNTSESIVSIPLNAIISGIAVSTTAHDLDISPDSRYLYLTNANNSISTSSITSQKATVQVTTPLQSTLWTASI